MSSGPEKKGHTYGTRRKSLGTRKKSSTALDLDADDRSFIRVLSDDDSDDDDDPVIVWSAFATWEVEPTPLGDINSLYMVDGSSKYFTHLREILHLVDRQDLLKLYGIVVKGGIWFFGLSDKQLWHIRRECYELMLRVDSNSSRNQLAASNLWLDTRYLVNSLVFSLYGLLCFEVASPKQTAHGKDISNPFMAVMTCQKSYSSSTSYDSCSENGKWLQSSMDHPLSGLRLDAGFHVTDSEFMKVAAFGVHAVNFLIAIIKFLIQEVWSWFQDVAV
ncbi:hypothetical protein Tco_0710884 [Tanacetum coccineum]